ncbi:hypothetical protein [Paracoccus niistensis]|uniref:DUF4760 domain-containing protein n=1 Tax=Paracoccus niistensis TaxID=632935 RepID=A0ABV6I4L4_9RHOB
MCQDPVPEKDALLEQSRGILKDLVNNNFGEPESIASWLRRHYRRWRTFLQGALVVLVIVILAAFPASELHQLHGASSDGQSLGKPENKGVFELVVDVLTALVAFIGICIAYSHWRRDKRSASFDSYYSRLDIANQRYDIWMRCSREKKISPLECAIDNEVQSHCYNMFVFSELDNLEYAIGKYKHDFIDDELASRAVKHFLLRCADHRFRKAAAARAIDGAYMKYTRLASDTCRDHMSEAVRSRSDSTRD